MNTHHLEMSYKGTNSAGYAFHASTTFHGTDKADCITKGKAHLREIGLDWTAITKVGLRISNPDSAFLSMIAPARRADGSYRV